MVQVPRSAAAAACKNCSAGNSRHRKNHTYQHTNLPLDEAGAACLDELSSDGRWMISSSALYGDGWEYRNPDRNSQCQVWSTSDGFERRWLLVIGDSRARMLYSALLTLLNHTLPAVGWPTHRAMGPVGKDFGCTPHSPRTPNRSEYWGYYDPRCQERFKGPCFDDHRGRTTRGCSLDYVTTAHTRLTFLWHSFIDKGTLSATAERVQRLMTAAGRAPDLLVASIGTWDMILTRESEDCCCERIGWAMGTLNKAIDSAVLPGSAGSAPAPLRVLYGFFNCPTCKEQGTDPSGGAAAVSVVGLAQAGEGSAASGCGNWPAARNMQVLSLKTMACARETARAQGFAYFDVGRSIRLAPPLLVSPCGSLHGFGLHAEVEAAMLLGALGASWRARPQRAQPDQTSAAFWAEWPAYTLGPLLQCASSDGVACPTKPVQVDANTTAERPEHHQGSSRVRQASLRTM